MLYHLYIARPRLEIWNKFKNNTSPNLDLTTKIFSAIGFYLDHNLDPLVHDIPTLRRTLQSMPKEQISLYSKNIKQISMLLKEFE